MQQHASPKTLLSTQVLYIKRLRYSVFHLFHSWVTGYSTLSYTIILIYHENN